MNSTSSANEPVEIVEETEMIDKQLGMYTLFLQVKTKI
jgi:hypothetical protein